MNEIIRIASRLKNQRLASLLRKAGLSSMNEIILYYYLVGLLTGRKKIDEIQPSRTANNLKEALMDLIINEFGANKGKARTVVEKVINVDALLTKNYYNFLLNKLKSEDKVIGAITGTASARTEKVVTRSENNFLASTGANNYALKNKIENYINSAPGTPATDLSEEVKSNLFQGVQILSRRSGPEDMIREKSVSTEGIPEEQSQSFEKAISKQKQENESVDIYLGKVIDDTAIDNFIKLWRLGYGWNLKRTSTTRARALSHIFLCLWLNFNKDIFADIEKTQEEETLFNLLAMQSNELFDTTKSTVKKNTDLLDSFNEFVRLYQQYKIADNEEKSEFMSELIKYFKLIVKNIPIDLEMDLGLAIFETAWVGFLTDIQDTVEEKIDNPKGYLIINKLQKSRDLILTFAEPTGQRLASARRVASLYLRKR